MPPSCQEVADGDHTPRSMAAETTASAPPPVPTPGSEERHIIRGTALQQMATAVGVVVMLGVVTILGRTLTLSEFGLYGLAISIAGYMLVLQLSVEGATVRALAAAQSDAVRDTIFTTAIAIYVTLGVLAGGSIAALGVVLSDVLGIPAALHDEARESFLALGAVIALGWPFKACQDALRGAQCFGLAALGEIGGYMVVGILMALLVLIDAPLWSLIALGGSLSILVGLACAVLLAVGAGGPQLRPRSVDRASVRELLGVSSGLAITGLADLVIYSLDRVILAAFRSAATVGLYEGAARAHNLVRQLHGTLVLTVSPVASGYLARGDEDRLRELLVRGSRYVMAIVVPVTVVLITLSGPILEVWLGPKFRAADTAMSILCSYWLVGAFTGVAGAMLLAAGKVRELAQYAWMVAVLNLALSLALTPLLGLEGIVLGTSIPYFLLIPWFVRVVLRVFPMVGLTDLLREAVLPAYSGAVLLAGVLVGARAVVEVDSLAVLVPVGGIALVAYWALYALVWLRPSERALAVGMLRRHSSPA